MGWRLPGTYPPSVHRWSSALEASELHISLNVSDIPAANRHEAYYAFSTPFLSSTIKAAFVNALFSTSIPVCGDRY